MQIIFIEDGITLLIVNIMGWLFFHLLIAFIFGVIITKKRYNHNNLLFKIWSFEIKYDIYNRFFFIKKWKKLLPDGGEWFKNSIPKKNLAKKDKEKLLQFIQETCKAEIIHLSVILCSIFFFLWNDWRIALIMIAYALLENFWCVIAQRYNRIRLLRMINKRQITQQTN